jgi:hypothetical protein
MDICDFCSSPQVVKRFACRNFDSASKDAGVIYPGTQTTDYPTNLVLASKDYWAACKDCVALVEAHDINGLIRRALDGYEQKTGRRHPQRYELEQHLWRTYALFFRNRIEDTENRPPISDNC